MGLLSRTGWARGWVPDADAVNGPKDGLLRADNLTRDERGVLALRPGSAKINAVALADTDVHSLFTAVLSGTRYRMAGAAAAVYANGTSIATSIGSSGDTAFGSHLGQILFGRGTAKRKYDGTTVRNWGIGMTGGAPTIAAVTADTEVFATCAAGETTWTTEVGTAVGAGLPGNAAGYDGTANEACEVEPSTLTGGAVFTKLFGSNQDFSSYPGATVATDDDLVSFFLYLEAPENLIDIELEIGVNGTTTANVFQTDYYFFRWTTRDLVDQLPPVDIFDPDAQGITQDRIDQAMPPSSFSSRIQPVIGWQKLTVRRGDMVRVGNTTGVGWNTVRAVRFVATMQGGGTSTALRVDDVRVTSAALGAQYAWRYVYVYNSGTYQGKSAPSAVSSTTAILSQSATITAPSDGSRDSQVNEIWVYRMGGGLDAFYRVKVETGVSGTGAVAITDSLSDRDALIVNLRLETDNTTPPDSPLDIEGPYYDRTYVLTATHLYPSRRLNPDSFSSGQAIRVSGADEVAYWIKKALGGLYIGTTKDIYRLDGTGAELPDETIDFTLTALNIDHPPVSEAIAQEGNLLVYLADDGWRAMSGAGSSSLTGMTSLLYRGQTRHGVSAVNLTGGRFRAAIGKGQLVATTPEGASTTSTAILYRHTFADGAWERRTYGAQAWRCVHREPDGTLIASDSAGFVWTLDTGTQDATTDLAVVLWTVVDDDGLPFQRKDLWDLRIRADTGNADATASVHLDGSGSASTTVTVTQNGMGVTLSSLSALAVCRQVQLRVTGSFSTFRWYDVGIQYRARPVITVFAEPKPDQLSPVRRRFGGLTIQADTLGAVATVTPVLDDVDQTALSLTTSDAVVTTLTFDTLVGRDLWAKVAKATGFELYAVTPIILDTRPQVFKGITSPSRFGLSERKLMSGIQLRVCTLGAARTFTPYLDGVAQTSFSVTTESDTPEEYTHDFVRALDGIDLALSVDGDVELDDWRPLITATRPLGVLAWDSGPLDTGRQDLIWLREIRIKMRATSDVTVTPYFDDRPFPVVTIPLTGTQTTILSVPVGRAYKGRTPRIVVTSADAFEPYWIELVRRQTTSRTEKPAIRIAVTLGGRVAA